MSKKILSALLVLTLLVTSVCFMGIGVNAEETTWEVGDKPFAVVGGRQEPIIVSAANGEFYDDFIVPSNLKFDNFTAGNPNDKSFQLNNSSKNSISDKNGNVYVTMSLTEPDENGVNENAYGGSGKSINVNTNTTVGVNGPTINGNKSYFNSIRTNSYIDCTALSSLDDIAISFWVKTESPAQYSAALWDTTTASSAQKIYADPINIPAAGEYIITIPLQNFHVENTAYSKTTSISNFKMFGLEILFKTAGVESGEFVNMYFDNIGIYAVMPNFGAAKHTAAAVIKDNMDSYVNGEVTSEVTVASDKGSWVANANTLSVVERGNGKALSYNLANYKYSASEFTASNTVYTNNNNYIIDFADKDGNNLGKDGTLAFWVKASRATRMMVKTNHSSGLSWIATESFVIPAGESIVKIPLTVFYDQDANLKQIKKLHLTFCGVSPTTNNIGGIAGTLMIDDIAIEPTVVAGDANGDKVCDVIDIIRIKKILAAAKNYSEAPSADIYPDLKLNSYDIVVLRKFLLGVISSLPENSALITNENYQTVSPKFENWVNKTTDTLKMTDSANATYYYPDSEDTKAIRVDYSAIQAATGNAFYYNASMMAPYGSDSVFCFWVHSDQTVNLRYSYADYSNTDSKSIQCKWVTKTIPAGESIIEIPMSEMAPDGKDMAYKSLFQFQILVWKNANTQSESGTLYLDHFGFYDKDTTNNIPEVAE